MSRQTLSKIRNFSGQEIVSGGGGGGVGLSGARTGRDQCKQERICRCKWINTQRSAPHFQHVQNHFRNVAKP